MKSETFTIAQGKKIRKEQLSVLRQMLSAEAYCALLDECKLRDSKLNSDEHDGYSVFRGSSMDEWVHNWARREWLKKR